MQALQLNAYDGKIELVEKPLPRPKKGQVLVRMAAAPINPSDLSFIQGMYGFHKELPVVPGFEGSGTVVASGGGMMANTLVGRRVACSADQRLDGSWAQYMVTSAKTCIPLRRQVSLEQGAMLVVNPLTAWALIDIARAGKHQAIVQTAAAGALGRMLLRLGQRHGIKVINIVRRPAQAGLLTSLGAQHVLNSNHPEFEGQLFALTRKLNATLAFDAVAGPITGQLAAAMPRGSRLLVYGGLSQQISPINPGLLIFRSLKIEGFWLSDWLPRLSLPKLIKVVWQAQGLLAADLESEVHARLSLAQGAQAIKVYEDAMTKGKILFLMEDNPDRGLA